MKEDRGIQNFCGNITLLRKYHGFSKRKMAKKLGIGLWSLNKIENGELPPRLSSNVLFAVYESFGILPSQMFDLLLEEQYRHIKNEKG